jgi:hypothetical protein
MVLFGKVKVFLKHPKGFETGRKLKRLAKLELCRVNKIQFYLKG